MINASDVEADSEAYQGDNLLTDNIQLKQLLTLMVSSTVCGLVSIAGVVTNAMCIAVFLKQGGKESVNIPLLAMAVSHLICDLLMLWCCLWNIVVYLQSQPMVIEPVGFNAMTGYLPRIIFFRVTSWLMAFAALQRCVCVVLPLKVRLIFTPSKTAVMTSCVIITAFSAHLTIYVSRELRVISNPAINMTQLVMLVIPELLDLAYKVNQVIFIFLPMVNFIFILTCTLVLLIKLKSSLRWRQGKRATTAINKPTNGDSKSQPITETLGQAKTLKNGKESRMTKMIATTTAIFVACTLPSNAAIVYGTIVEFETATTDYLHALAFLFETLNSSVTLMVYYKMSSNFRSNFLILMQIFSIDI
uniref:G-protein coupled receptors family 1 profile domain-containing protein n=1 Tax=Biomphalaria glabrata TaxID=6526 RepID=A0A2C9KZX8_BIOGL